MLNHFASERLTFDYWTCSTLNRNCVASTRALLSQL